MREFDSLCKQVEQLEPAVYVQILGEKAERLIPALSAITEDGLDGLTLFASLIVGSVVADGKLSAEEYALCYPVFRAFFGQHVNYDDCNRLVKSMRDDNREVKRFVNDMADVLGMIDEELKEDVIIVCLLLCAVDGKISLKEKAWIKQIMR